MAEDFSLLSFFPTPSNLSCLEVLGSESLHKAANLQPLPLIHIPFHFRHHMCLLPGRCCGNTHSRLLLLPRNMHNDGDIFLGKHIHTHTFLTVYFFSLSFVHIFPRIVKCTCMMRSFHPVINGKFVDFYSFYIHTSFTFVVALSQDESEWLINVCLFQTSLPREVLQGLERRLRRR